MLLFLLFLISASKFQLSDFRVNFPSLKYLLEYRYEIYCEFCLYEKGNTLITINLFCCSCFTINEFIFYCSLRVGKLFSRDSLVAGKAVITFSYARLIFTFTLRSLESNISVYPFVVKYFVLLCTCCLVEMKRVNLQPLRQVLRQTERTACSPFVIYLVRYWNLNYSYHLPLSYTIDNFIVCFPHFR